ncbi:MAG: prepilin-type N-terminal cleavage/methylation domain-containing protein [Tepidimonas sp.]|nr:prepilin-type N-terminal cleavage/methylation domain-containing protein [Tepidimonas sp.]
MRSGCFVGVRTGGTAARVMRGFTLLEALVAIAIAALALGALARAAGQGTRTAAEVADRQQAAMVARAVLSMGTFAEDYLAAPEGESPPWAWRVRVTPQPVVLADAAHAQPDQTLLAARLTVEVFRPGDGGAEPVWVLSAWKPYRSAP